MLRTPLLSLSILSLTHTVSANETNKVDNSSMYTTTFASGLGCFNDARNGYDFYCGPHLALSRTLLGKTSQSGIGSVRLEAGVDLLWGTIVNPFVADDIAAPSTRISAALMVTGNLLALPMTPTSDFGIEAGAGYSIVVQRGDNKEIYNAFQAYVGAGFNINDRYYSLQVHTNRQFTQQRFGTGVSILGRYSIPF